MNHTSHDRDTGEVQLDHVLGDKTMRAYARGDMMAKRRAMMLDWEKFLAEPVPPQVFEYKKLVPSQRPKTPDRVPKDFRVETTQRLVTEEVQANPEWNKGVARASTGSV
jgi:hypothetical protein